MLDRPSQTQSNLYILISISLLILTTGIAWVLIFVFILDHKFSTYIQNITPVFFNFLQYYYLASILIIVSVFGFFIINMIQKKIKKKLTANEYAKQFRSKQFEKAKDAFITHISHELLTPMNGIIGITKMLAKYNCNNLSVQQKQGLSMILQSSTELLSIITDLISISRIHAGKIKPHLTVFSIEELLLIQEENIKDVLKNRDIRFLINTNNKIPKEVVSDENILDQVLKKLLNNAIKFTKKGKIVLKLYIENKKLFFEIKDTGIGISQNFFNTIFEEFRQVDEAINREYEGMGIGLALCKQLINLLQGDIKAKSQLNKGTVMTFYIPLIKPEFNVNSI